MGQRRDEKSRRMGLWSETWMWGEVARCSRERREREESRGGESAWPRNKEVAPPRRHKGRKVRQAFTKFYQKHSSFALHKRKTQKNTIPTGERGQAGNRRIQNSRGFNLYFYFCLHQKVLHFAPRSGRYTQKATTSRHFVSCGSSSQ